MPLAITPIASNKVASAVNESEIRANFAGFLLPVNFMNEKKVAKVKTTDELKTAKLLIKAVSIYVFSSAAKHKALIVFRS